MDKIKEGILNMKLLDKVVIITGSSMGIGEAIAEKFLIEGAKVVLNSRSQSRVDETVKRFIDQGFKSVIGIGADVSTESGAEKLVQGAVSSFGTVNILINNAGINRIAPSYELKVDEYKRVLDTNLAGYFITSKAVGNYFKDNNGGVIINIGSIFGQVFTGGRAAYSSTKSGLKGLTNVLAVEWAPDNIRVNQVAPGYIKTNLDELDQSDGGYSDEDIIRRTPMRRYGTAEEVANATAFLASDEASYITGTVITVDGGWTAFGGWS
ncbi:MAG: SDR family oxidoreductase [Streptococcaceae bacterium]|jgi:3-oxoacyl-[acyl-carrier protein] reductase|nr:SDR family oxidoreductase [Streptococcaceae bacterium]MCH4176349.1 SDR family oxidoreductase [Streptococcaceae bacterium]